MNEVSTYNDLKTASFKRRNTRSWLQTEYIVALLKRGIDGNKILTKEDIIDCYVDFHFDGDETISRREWDYWLKREVVVTYTKETFRKRTYDQTALKWFKSNLGSAILQGKVLALPVIELMPNDLNAEVCDATKADQGTEAG